MQITIDAERATGPQLAGLLALLASTAPDALDYAFRSMGHTATANTLELPFAEPVRVELTPGEKIEVVVGRAGASTPAELASLAAEGAPADATVTPPPVPASAVRDADGLPWDARIHATASGGGGVLTQAGKWRAKRGVSEDLVAQVTAELLGRAGQPAPEVTVPPPPAAPPVPQPPPFDFATVTPPPPFAPPAAVPPPPFTPDVPVPPAPPAPSFEPPLPGAPFPVTPRARLDVDGNISFADLAREIHRLQAAGGFTTTDVMAAVNRYGKQSLGQLAVDDEAFTRSSILTDLRALAAEKGVA